eukprot:2683975-Amphidinium_carterae.1
MRAMTTRNSSTWATGRLENFPRCAMRSAGTSSLQCSVSFVLQSISTPPMTAHAFSKDPSVSTTVMH